MIDTLPDEMLEPITEENKNNPPIFDPISGTSDIQYGNKTLAEIEAKVGTHPIRLTGEMESDPRDKHSFPGGMEQMAELLVPDEETGIANEDLLSTELDMQMKRTMGLPSTALPGYPFTPEELSGIFRDAIPAPKEAYTIWIPHEPEIIERTAVGKYRQCVEGDIIRFTVEHNDFFTSFVLIADASEYGFSWHQMTTTSGSINDGLLNVSESQRLEQLLRNDGGNFLATLPDRVRHASGLLGKRLTPDNQTPTPDEWITTMCERDSEKSVPFRPRYEVTFIHKDEEIVIELIPLQAEEVVKEMEAEQTSTGYGIDYETTAASKTPSPGYEWRVSFADDDIVASLNKAYNEQIHAEDAIGMMLYISEMVNK